MGSGPPVMSIYEDENEDERIVYMQHFQDALQRLYGIMSRQIEEQQGGWSARALRVDSEQGLFFLKAYPKQLSSTAQWTAAAFVYLPLLARLGENTKLRAHLPQLYPALDGAWSCEDEAYIYQLFRYIEGYTVGEGDLDDAQATTLATIVAAVHGYGEQDIPGESGILREEYALPFSRKLLSFLGEDMPGAGAALRDLLLPYAEPLQRACAMNLAQAEALKGQAHHRRLCHMDLHHWNLMQGEELVLIDWEGVKLAPCEADLFMIMERSYWPAFWRQYRQERPDVQLNEELLFFYRLRRQLEDIWDYIARLIYDDPEVDEVKTSFYHMERCCREAVRLLGEGDAQHQRV